MKKNKKSLKKLSLNKNVVSNLENNQISGGTNVSVFICPIETRFNCPIVTLVCETLQIQCVKTISPDCLITRVCSQLGCPSDFIC
ncbi:class I lanthipeptide [Kordia sp.]|uniref:class I lanthipeptide n=1 Tax=Kordia sp. TaxID=1965332 RepID=UPI003D2DB898